MRFAIEVFYVVLGLIAAVIIAALSSWAVPLARREIWIIAYVGIAFTIGMGFKPMREGWIADRADAPRPQNGKKRMKIAVIGTGRVGGAIAPNIAAAGHDVVYGVRDPADPKHASSKDGVARRATADAAAWAEIIVLAIGWDAVDGALTAMGPITGKILIDPINPYDFMNNLASLIAPDQSAARLLQAKTDAVVVKALNQVGSMVMADAPARRIKPVQFVATDDPAAKAKVIALLADIGFDARDAGGLDYARELEGMARLWIAQAFGHGMAPGTGWALIGADA